jgi:hypothetical protein
MVAKAAAMAAHAVTVAAAADDTAAATATTTMPTASSAASASEGFGLERACAQRQACNNNDCFLQHDISPLTCPGIPPGRGWTKDQPEAGDIPNGRLCGPALPGRCGVKPARSSAILP